MSFVEILVIGPSNPNLSSLKGYVMRLRRAYHVTATTHLATPSIL